MFADWTFYLNELSDERKCWNTKCPITFLIVCSRLCWHPVRCVHSQYPHVVLIRAIWNMALPVTHIVVARTKACLTTLTKHFERTETHSDVTQRPRHDDALQVYRSFGDDTDVLTISHYLPYWPKRMTVHHDCCLFYPQELHDTSAVADDIPLHCHTEFCDYLKTLFPGNWIGRKRPIP